MTLRVRITHDQPEYPADLAVMLTDAKGSPSAGPNQVIRPGESADFYVHSNQRVVVIELAHMTGG